MLLCTYERRARPAVRVKWKGRAGVDKKKEKTEPHLPCRNYKHSNNSNTGLRFLSEKIIYPWYIFFFFFFFPRFLVYPLSGANERVGCRWIFCSISGAINLFRSRILSHSIPSPELAESTPSLQIKIEFWNIFDIPAFFFFLFFKNVKVRVTFYFWWLIFPYIWHIYSSSYHSWRRAW